VKDFFTFGVVECCCCCWWLGAAVALVAAVEWLKLCLEFNSFVLWGVPVTGGVAGVATPKGSIACFSKLLLVAGGGGGGGVDSFCGVSAMRLVGVGDGGSEMSMGCTVSLVFVLEVSGS
jgi:hypothetical protein